MPSKKTRAIDHPPTGDQSHQCLNDSPANREPECSKAEDREQNPKGFRLGGHGSIKTHCQISSQQPTAPSSKLTFSSSLRGSSVSERQLSWLGLLSFGERTCPSVSPKQASWPSRSAFLRLATLCECVVRISADAHGGALTTLPVPQEMQSHFRFG